MSESRKILEKRWGKTPQTLTEALDYLEATVSILNATTANASEISLNLDAAMAALTAAGLPRARPDPLVLAKMRAEWCGYKITDEEAEEEAKMLRKVWAMMDAPRVTP